VKFSYLFLLGFCGASPTLAQATKHHFLTANTIYSSAHIDGRLMAAVGHAAERSFSIRGSDLRCSKVVRTMNNDSHASSVLAFAWVEGGGVYLPCGLNRKFAGFGARTFFRPCWGVGLYGYADWLGQNGFNEKCLTLSNVGYEKIYVDGEIRNRGRGFLDFLIPNSVSGGFEVFTSIININIECHMLSDEKDTRFVLLQPTLVFEPQNALELQLWRRYGKFTPLLSGFYSVLTRCNRDLIMVNEDGSRLWHYTKEPHSHWGVCGVLKYSF
jgi:hypothetical protein